MLRDVEFLATVVPEVTRVEKLSETSALWTVSFKLGMLKRSSVYRGEVVHASDDGLEFRAVGPEAEIRGKVELVPDGTGGTRVRFTLAADGTGSLRAIIDNILARRLSEDSERFARTVQSRLAASGPHA